MAGKRLKVSAGDCSALTPAQRNVLVEAISAALEEGAHIPWRTMVESPTFASLTYDTLRREGKSVIRQLNQQEKDPIGPTKRRIEHVDEDIAEPEQQIDELADKDEIIADQKEQIEALNLQLRELNALVAEKEELVAGEEKLQKQVGSLQQCVTELSTIIANKDLQLAAASARYEALKDAIRQLADDELAAGGN